MSGNHQPIQSSAEEALHIPVMLTEALGALGMKPGGIYIDGTFGAGGYSRAILESFPDIQLFAFDQDPSARVAGEALARQFHPRFRLIEDRFSTMADHDLPKVDGVVLDIGVSSMQVDQALRGFSFRHDGPLDMRMGQGGETAADIINSASEERIADILYHFGEERLSRVIARAVIAERAKEPITTTRKLADLISRVIRTKPGDIHPATRSFQALRIAVNDELGELARALHAAERLLKPDGALVVVSFHSLEDRIVKQFFSARSGKGGASRYVPMQQSVATFRVEGKWPATADDDEVRFNPRARSAKLRAALRLDCPARPEDPAIMALASLPEQRPGRRNSKAGQRPQGERA
jgi:16S rRNA (cytosine1402-N4)-methyltransferase